MGFDGHAQNKREVLHSLYSADIPGRGVYSTGIWVGGFG